MGCAEHTKQDETRGVRGVTLETSCSEKVGILGRELWYVRSGRARRQYVHTPTTQRRDAVAKLI